MTRGRAARQHSAILLVASVLSVGVCTLTAFASDTWPDAFDRRGFKLGMSLPDFRAAPFPDITDAPGTSAVCSDEERAKDKRYASVAIAVDLFEGTGAVQCGFYFTDPGNPPMPMDSDLKLLDQPMATSFVFIPADDGEKRLAAINTFGPSDRVGDIVRTMKQAYGEPAQRVEKLQNGFGAIFESNVYVWSRGGSEIQLNSMSTTRESFHLEHRIPSLLDRVEKLKNEQAAKDASKL